MPGIVEDIWGIMSVSRIRLKEFWSWFTTIKRSRSMRRALHNITREIFVLMSCKEIVAES